jgi:hypothetical protein
MGPTKPALATSVLFLPVVNQPEPDVDHSPPSSAEGSGMSGAIPLLPVYALVAWNGRTSPCLHSISWNTSLTDIEIGLKKRETGQVCWPIQ